MTVAESEERAQFTLAMRARGVNDLKLLRALERAPRALFMPPRFADISARDMALPIGCGQTSPPPSIVAAMIVPWVQRPLQPNTRSTARYAASARKVSLGTEPALRLSLLTVLVIGNRQLLPPRTTNSLPAIASSFVFSMTPRRIRSATYSPSDRTTASTVICLCRHRSPKRWLRRRLVMKSSRMTAKAIGPSSLSVLNQRSVGSLKRPCEQLQRSCR
jgi:hypothetical protein